MGVAVAVNSSAFSGILLSISTSININSSSGRRLILLSLSIVRIITINHIVDLYHPPRLDHHLPAINVSLTHRHPAQTRALQQQTAVRDGLHR